MIWQKHLKPHEQEELRVLCCDRIRAQSELEQFSLAIAKIRNRCVLRQRRAKAIDTRSGETGTGSIRQDESAGRKALPNPFKDHNHEA